MPLDCKCLLTYAESFPFDAQCPCQTASYPPSSFRHLRSCFDPCNVAAAGCDCYWNLYFSSLRAVVEASAWRAVVAYSWNWNCCAAFVAAVAVDAAVVVAAAYDAAAFPQVVDEASAEVDVRKTDFHASLRTKLADYQPVTAVAFRREASPSADFLDDMKGACSLAADGAAAFDVAVQEAPMRGDARAVGEQPQGYRSAVQPDHQKEPSS